MKVREVNPKDPRVSLVLEILQLECLPYDKPAQTSKGYWWIAYSDSGVPIGFAALYPSLRWADAGYMARSGVLPSHRGKGLQKALIKARIRKARKLGYKWLLSDTRDNPASSNSLIACGFRLYQPSKPWAFKNSLYFRLKL